MSRFMMQSSHGQPSPLTFSDSGGNTLIVTSASASWRGIPFEMHEIPQVDEIAVIPTGQDQGMMISVQGTQTCVLHGAGAPEITLQPGLINFANAQSRWRVARTIGTSRAVLLRLTGYWRQLLADGGPKDFSRQLPVPPSQTALSLALAMVAEVEDGAPSGALFAETLSLALLHYVIERAPVSSVRVRGSLSDHARRRIARFIDDNLHEDVRLSDLAALTGLQSRHFSTLFRRAFGVTPHRYLLERRLARAAQLLATTGLDITEIALTLGFASQSHFSAAFRRRFGASPRGFARSRRRSFAGL